MRDIKSQFDIKKSLNGGYAQSINYFTLYALHKWRLSLLEEVDVYIINFF